MIGFGSFESRHRILLRCAALCAVEISRKRGTKLFILLSCGPPLDRWVAVNSFLSRSLPRCHEKRLRALLHGHILSIEFRSESCLVRLSCACHLIFFSSCNPSHRLDCEKLLMGCEQSKVVPDSGSSSSKAPPIKILVKPPGSPRNIGELTQLAKLADRMDPPAYLPHPPSASIDSEVADRTVLSKVTPDGSSDGERQQSHRGFNSCQSIERASSLFSPCSCH